MNLIPSKGFRTVYTVSEVAEFCGVTRCVVKGWVGLGKTQLERIERADETIAKVDAKPTNLTAS